jgi:zinc transport system substrate-binding protein
MLVQLDQRAATVRFPGRALAVVAIAVASVGAACGSDKPAVPSTAGGGRLSVVASFYPISVAAERVGGDRVHVTNLTSAGVEPHDLELTPKQVDALQGADLVLYLGQGFQPAVAALARRRGARAVDLLHGMNLAAEAGASPAPTPTSKVDPHFWLSPPLMAAAVDEIAGALVAASPRDTAVFRANAARYRADIHALDTEYQRGLAACDRKELVTAHAAFFYLAARYGLTQLPITGVTPEAEPDPARLATLADEIKAKHITTVFFEELVSPKVAQTLARETGATTAVLSPIEGLSKHEISAGKDYLTVMRENLAALRLALGCR